jgi:hypothetical protein
MVFGNYASGFVAKLSSRIQHGEPPLLLGIFDPTEATFSNKLADSIRDWEDRSTGRFRYALGAHACLSRTLLVDRGISQI